MDFDLSKEYDQKINKMCDNRIETSFYKYGAARENFGRKLVNARGCMDKCLKAYDETHNLDYLLDVINYCRFAVTYRQDEKDHLRPTDSNESAGIDGMSINEIRNFDK